MENNLGDQHHHNEKKSHDVQGKNGDGMNEVRGNHGKDIPGQ